MLTVITGVAGSGKSTLVTDGLLAQHPDAITIDQVPVATSIRSTPATYTAMMDDIRRLFARVNKVSASLFSFNSTGACPNCQGLDVVYTDLAFLKGLKSTCEQCRGQRFTPEVLGHTVRGRSIADVLAMAAAQALDFFTETKLRSVRPVLRRVPVLDRLADRGSSVVIIEHNLDVIRNAGWITDLGPEAGTQGGRIVFEGTPRQLLTATGSHTAGALRRDQAPKSLDVPAGSAVKSPATAGGNGVVDPAR